MKAVIAFVFLVMTLACSHEPESTGPVNQYNLRGVVIRVVPKHRIAIIKHQKIEGWMEAMTMEFPVKEQREFDMLRPGLAITAKVNSRPSDYEYWISDVTPDPQPVPAETPPAQK